MLDIFENCRGSVILTDKTDKDLEEKAKVISLCSVYDHDKTEEIREYIAPEDDDIAEMIFTTGTTGKPKGVMLSYRSVRNIINNTIEGVEITKEDRLLLALPLKCCCCLRLLSHRSKTPYFCCNG